MIEKPLWVEPWKMEGNLYRFPPLLSEISLRKLFENMEDFRVIREKLERQIRWEIRRMKELKKGRAIIEKRELKKKSRIITLDEKTNIKLNDIQNMLRTFEMNLRDFIIKKMEEKERGNWWTEQRIPKGVMEESHKNRKDILDPPIYYISLGSYMHIILKKNNWNEIFAPIFSKKNEFESKMEEIIEIRNLIFHSRIDREVIVKLDDFSNTIRLYTQKFYNLMELDIENPIELTKRHGMIEKTKIFISHGKDLVSLKFFTKILSVNNFDPIIVYEEPNFGETIPEKVIRCLHQSEIILILATPDDEVHLKNGSIQYQPRANVIYELGYAKATYPKKVILLKEERVTLSSDFDSLAYIKFDSEDKQSLKIAAEEVITNIRAMIDYGM